MKVAQIEAGRSWWPQDTTYNSVSKHVRHRTHQCLCYKTQSWKHAYRYSLSVGSSRWVTETTSKPRVQSTTDESPFHQHEQFEAPNK
jgi:hypothetical protein